jgi:hypothetical protein
MLCAGLIEGLIHAWLNIADGLTANGSQLRNHKVTSALEHPLLSKRERFVMAQISEVLQHVGYFKDIAGAHLLGESLEAILPIVTGRDKIVCQGFEERFTFDRRDWGAEADF